MVFINQSLGGRLAFTNMGLLDAEAEEDCGSGKHSERCYVYLLCTFCEGILAEMSVVG